MEAKAIEMIRDLAVASASITLNTQTPTTLVPEAFRIQNLEGFSTGRSRFRGTFTSSSLKDFADHVIARKGEGTAKGFVDIENADKLSCKVFFNIGNEQNPGHCDDTAVLNLKRTAAYDALRGIVDKPLTQKALSEWMEDWRSTLSAIHSSEAPVDMRQAINAVRNITIETTAKTESQVGNFEGKRSAMEQIEARSADLLPAYIVMKAQPYQGLQPREFALAISVITGGDKPMLSMRWMQKEVLLEEMGQEFKQAISSEIGGAADLLIGSFNPN